MVPSVQAAEAKLAEVQASLTSAETVKASLLRDTQLALGNQGDLKQSLNVVRAKVSKLEAQVRHPTHCPVARMAPLQLRP